MLKKKLQRKIIFLEIWKTFNFSKTNFNFNLIFFSLQQLRKECICAVFFVCVLFPQNVFGINFLLVSLTLSVVKNRCFKLEKSICSLQLKLGKGKKEGQKEDWTNGCCCQWTILNGNKKDGGNRKTNYVFKEYNMQLFNIKIHLSLSQKKIYFFVYYVYILFFYFFIWCLIKNDVLVLLPYYHL